MPLHVIFGPMFSGKTTELLRRVRRYSAAQKRCLLVKYTMDTRHQGIVTHDGNSHIGLYMARARELAEVDTADVDVIGIDEGQFFPDIVVFCGRMAEAGKIVVVAALDGTFQRRPFGDVLNLVPLADSVIKLSAVCVYCFKDAPFSARLSDEQEEVVVGGADKYAAVCRSCRVV